LLHSQLLQPLYNPILDLTREAIHDDRHRAHGWFPIFEPAFCAAHAMPPLSSLWIAETAAAAPSKRLSVHRADDENDSERCQDHGCYAYPNVLGAHDLRLRECSCSRMIRHGCDVLYEFACVGNRHPQSKY
jgi:hypothetical protein